MTTKDTAVEREGFPRPVPDTPDNVFDQFKMTNRVVIVNGAAEGIGASVAEGMAEAGAHVALWYNSNDAAIKKAEELAQKHGVKTKAYKVNVTDADTVKSTIEEVVKDFGGIDCFVANAGMGNSKGILDTSIEEYRQQVAVNGKLKFCYSVHKRLLISRQSTASSTAPSSSARSSSARAAATSSSPPP